MNQYNIRLFILFFYVFMYFTFFIFENVPLIDMLVCLEKSYLREMKTVFRKHKGGMS